MKKLVCGVGINDVDYVVQVQETVGYVDGKRKRKLVWICPFYRTWKNMLVRSYSDKYKAEKPTYEESTTIEEWHLFSKFKAWMETQPWEGHQLDKDILVRGNKVYGPETCVFVSNVVNTFMLDCGASRGQYMIGVYWDKASSKFMAQCSNPFTKKRERLGLFDSELVAHKVWLKRKLELTYKLAFLQTDERVAKALINRYENYTKEKT